MKPQNFTVSRGEAGQSLAAVLQLRSALRPAAARELIRGGMVRVASAVCRDPSRRLRPGQRVQVSRPTSPRPISTRPSAPAGVHIRFCDDQVVVVDKPAGLTTMRHPEEAAEFGPRGRRFLPSTLADLLPPLLPGPRGRLRPVHRLDRDTSGLVVFARTREAEADLGRQFRAHAVDRKYLAIVRGSARAGRIASDLVRDRGDGRRGSTPAKEAGKHAVTHIAVLEAGGNYSLVECRLETGRTHQVRIHLGEAGTPLFGEHIYDRPLHGQPISPDRTGFTRPALHAAELGFEHPTRRERLRWTSPLPKDMAALLQRLRRQPRTNG